MRGECGSELQGSTPGHLPREWSATLWITSSEVRGSLWQTENTVFRITLRSLAWLVWSWSATPEMPKKRRCIRSSAVGNPAGPFAFTLVVVGRLEAEDREGEKGEREGVDDDGLLCCCDVLCTRLGSCCPPEEGEDEEDGSSLSMGRFAPKWGKGSTSSSTITPSPCGPPSPVLHNVTALSSRSVSSTGRGSNTSLLLDPCETKSWDCPLWCSSGREVEFLGDRDGVVQGVAELTSTTLAPCCTLDLELATLPVSFSTLLCCALAIFLEADALSLFLSRVPSPSELHRACSNTSNCSLLRYLSSSLHNDKRC